LIDPRATIWSNFPPIDPILTPISDVMIASALCISMEQFKSMSKSGLISKSCSIDIEGEHTTYYCNYWDAIQTSAFCSLISIGLPFDVALNLSELICDALAFSFEQLDSCQHVSLEEIISIIDAEMQDYLIHFKLHVIRFGRISIATKIAIDIFNMNTKLLDRLEDLSRIRSGEMRRSVH
jgi:hypothetical protein